jgi:hypothetical protein
VDDITNNNKVINNNTITSVSEEDSKNNNNNLECSEEDCSFVYYEEEPGDRSVSICDEELQLSKHSIFNDIAFSNCEFDVETFNQFLKDEHNDDNNHNCCHLQHDNDDDDDSKSDESDFFCDCLVETVPLYHQNNTTDSLTLSSSDQNIMRETGANKLRGLLKPANRPPPVRKNRVVFDETRNEFFEADYIILIREDCPYDEEDEEPCTCGDHELVRICCDEGCNCGYADVDDGRTPPVSFYFLFFQLFQRFKSIMKFLFFCVIGKKFRKLLPNNYSTVRT